MDHFFNTFLFENRAEEIAIAHIPFIKDRIRMYCLSLAGLEVVNDNDVFASVY